MRREQARGRRFGGEVGVESEHDIGRRLRAFELEAVQQRDAVGDRHNSTLQPHSCSKTVLILGPGPHSATKLS